LETVAEDVASMALKEFTTPSVLVRVKKRALSGMSYAAVEIARKARSSA
jgi:dihydroneopterin aldolase